MRDFVANPDDPKPVVRWNAHHGCRFGNVLDGIVNVELWPPEQGRVREDGAVERDEEPVNMKEGKAVELAENRQFSEHSMLSGLHIVLRELPAVD